MGGGLSVRLFLCVNSLNELQCDKLKNQFRIVAAFFAVAFCALFFA
jgi:hypothetical protein